MKRYKVTMPWRAELSVTLEAATPEIAEERVLEAARVNKLDGEMVAHLALIGQNTDVPHRIEEVAPDDWDGTGQPYLKLGGLGGGLGKRARGHAAAADTDAFDAWADEVVKLAAVTGIVNIDLEHEIVIESMRAMWQDGMDPDEAVEAIKGAQEEAP